MYIEGKVLRKLPGSYRSEGGEKQTSLHKYVLRMQMDRRTFLAAVSAPPPPSFK